MKRHVQHLHVLAYSSKHLKSYFSLHKLSQIQITKRKHNFLVLMGLQTTLYAIFIVPVGKLLMLKS